jgi:REP element-mobilizing transposase RayT
MALWRIYFHLVWATKNRYPYLTSEKQAKMYPYIVSKSQELECIVHGIGGIEDHVHLIVSIPPKLAVAQFVKNIKGSSSYFYNNHFSDDPKFAWQEGYGVFSLGSKQLEIAVNYVSNQKQHHQNKTIISSLEVFKDEDDRPSKYLP